MSFSQITCLLPQLFPEGICLQQSMEWMPLAAAITNVSRR